MAIARRIGYGMKIVIGDYCLKNAETICTIMNNAGYDTMPFERDLSSRESILDLIAEAQRPTERYPCLSMQPEFPQAKHLKKQFCVLTYTAQQYCLKKLVK